MSGARAVQHDILEKYPRADLFVYTVWLPAVMRDTRSAWQSSTMPDHRVTNVWDEDGVISDWFSHHLDGPRSRTIIWDAYLLYGSQCRWDDKSTAPSQLVSRGGTIIGSFSDLRANLIPLLQTGSP